MADFGTLNLDEEAKQNEKDDYPLNKGRITSGSKNEQLFSNRYTIVDNNFEDDDKEEENNDNIMMNDNDINKNKEINKKENIIDSKRVSNRDSNKLRKNIINIKIILLGNVSVGKTSIVGRYINNSFSENYKTTIQAEQSTKIINEDDDTSIRLNIWDTAGQEKFRAITRQYYNDALGAVIAFDLTDKKSFNDVKSWISDLKNHGADDTVIMVLGNKSDLSGERFVTHEEIKEAFGNNYNYYDVSAKNGNNISLAFDKLKKLIIENIKIKEKKEANNIYSNNINLKAKKKNLSSNSNKRGQSLDDIDKNLKEKDKKCC